MSATTTTPSMKAALVAQLQARGGLAGVIVDRQWPASLGDYYEAVLLCGPVADAMTPVAMGMGASLEGLDETYTHIVYISVVQNGIDGAGCEDRAYALMAEVEDQIGDDPTISGTVDASWPDGYDAAGKANAATREHFIAMRIKVKTFIGG